ncbi:unnamed protein product [Angiostrongylus costaricensis]|uniref:SCP domain-containing protein n=1 Tax=Angiostrongylus costaricensis TaxID=334426 RepID=A0A0R3PAH5_ANGCS|nr:unnamed protein product [Angiostrongylus costaricensis]
MFQFLISGFNSEAEMDEKQVFAFPEGNGTKTFLVRIEYFNVDSKKANVTVPPKPTTRKPVQPTTSRSIQPGSDKCKLNNGMNDAIRNDFLNEHNRLRSFTANGLAKNPLGTNGYAPKGARILKMVYDCSVEETAAIHANKCVFKHTVGGKNGENLWAIFPKQENITGMGKTATYSWFIELEKFGMPPDNILTDEIWNRPNMPVGHYTQVSTLFVVCCFSQSQRRLVQRWCMKVRTSSAVVLQCAQTRHLSSANTHLRMSYLFHFFLENVLRKNALLNYFSGNYIGSTIYTIGEPCKTDSDCQCDGCKCSPDEALCIKPN